ncbi:MAG: hypothetical protein QG629_254 [Patescibacteria group bacterium]|nr:hypothetical protein [Candidatus Saccharibacteria bacterium]MDQ5963172.1 hypothetical protein [Patescibacteria group bacterium]
MKSTNKSTPTIVGIVALLAIIGSAGYVIRTSSASDQNPSTISAAKAEDDTAATTAAMVHTTADTTTSATQTATTSGAISAYKDGTYSTTAKYQVPHGYQNSIAVKATIKDGKITSVSTDDTYSDHESRNYIDAFESDVENTVVGQYLGDFSASRIGGASLTTMAFDEAIQTITSQAKA